MDNTHLYILIGVLGLFSCHVNSQQVKRPSWIVGRSLDDETIGRLNAELASLYQKRPSWLAGRSIADTSDELPESEKSPSEVYQKRPSWLAGRSLLPNEDENLHLTAKRPSWLVGRSFKKSSKEPNSGPPNKRPSWLNTKRTIEKYREILKNIFD